MNLSPAKVKTGRPENCPGLASPDFSAKAGCAGVLLLPRAKARSKANRNITQSSGSSGRIDGIISLRREKAKSCRAGYCYR